MGARRQASRESPQKSREKPRRGAPPPAPGELRSRWERLHRGDREPWPDAARIGRLARKHRAFAASLERYAGAEELARGLQGAWAEFHAGEFGAAIEHGEQLGPLGASVANKAAAVSTLYSAAGAPEALATLEAAVSRAEAAVEALPDYPNAHYLLSLVLGRYSQRISILKALAEGLAGRVRSHLERTLELEPRHAEAHLAFGLYHAEIVGKLGALAAALTYGAGRDAALEHFGQAARLAPDSPIVLMERANGLLLLDARRYRDEARALYAQAAALAPGDAMERLDIERAKRGPG
ncbi:MAG TPA: hypothetical protein VEH00_06595 [Steroidobacteraceae bacterium]|nr:hypothetical protein [Steroidobacteraceae bacterium]